MKSLLFGFPFLFLTCINSLAQKPGRTHYLMISVYENISLIPRSSKTLVVTKEDGKQEVSILHERPDYSLKNFKAGEDSIFNLLKPYFDDGWKLMSSNTIEIPQSSSVANYLTRYFLSKQDEK